MREAALDVLLQLYAAPANLSPLHVFTERFQQRFAELVREARGSNLLHLHDLILETAKLSNKCSRLAACHVEEDVVKALLDWACPLRQQAIWQVGLTTCPMIDNPIP